jgi:HSP20 family protein
MNRFASGYDDLFNTLGGSDATPESGAASKRPATPADLAEFLALAAEAIEGIGAGEQGAGPGPVPGSGPVDPARRRGGRRIPAMPAPMDVLEVPEGLLVLIDLPGVSEGDLEIVAAREAIRIRAARRLPLPPAARPVRRERPAVVVERLIAIPPGFAGTRLEARLESGVLAVMVPRIQTPLETPEHPAPDDGDRRDDGSSSDDGGWPGPWNPG